MTFLEEVKKQFPMYAGFLDTITAVDIFTETYSSARIKNMLNHVERFQTKRYRLFDLMNEINKDMCDCFLDSLSKFFDKITCQETVTLSFTEDFIKGIVGIYIANRNIAEKCYDTILNLTNKYQDILMREGYDVPYLPNLASNILFNESTYPIKIHFLNDVRASAENVDNHTFSIPFHLIKFT